jgi:hypothetical protein
MGTRNQAECGAPCVNLRAIVDELGSQGFTNVRTVTAELNEREILTPRGGSWHSTSAARLLSRLKRDGL